MMTPKEERKAMDERHIEEYSKLLNAQLKAMHEEGLYAMTHRWDCFHQAIELGQRHGRELAALRVSRVSENGQSRRHFCEMLNIKKRRGPTGEIESVCLPLRRVSVREPSCPLCWAASLRCLRDWDSSAGSASQRRAGNQSCKPSP